MNCPYCQRDNSDEFVFCYGCGKRFELASPLCKCGAQLFSGEKFCRKCGQQCQSFSNTDVSGSSSAQPNNKKALEGKHKKSIILSSAIAVILIVSIALLLTAPPRVNFDDMILELKSYALVLTSIQDIYSMSTSLYDRPSTVIIEATESFEAEYPYLKFNYNDESRREKTSLELLLPNEAQSFLITITLPCSKSKLIGWLNNDKTKFLAFKHEVCEPLQDAITKCVEFLNMNSSYQHGFTDVDLSTQKPYRCIIHIKARNSEEIEFIITQDSIAYSSQYVW